LVARSGFPCMHEMFISDKNHVRLGNLCYFLQKNTGTVLNETVGSTVYWKEYFPNLLERWLLPWFLFLTLETSGLHHRTGFVQIFWFLTQIGPAKWLNWAKQLICGCCFTSVEVCSKRRNNSWFLASTVVIQQPHMSYYNPFNHCICPIWVQSQKFWSKPGLWWRPEVPKSKYKKLGQQSSFRRLGKYSFKWKGN
jgi:hypothetical protein